MYHPLSLSCYFNDLLQHLKAQQNLRCLQPSALCQGLVSGHAVLRKRAAKYSLIKCEHTAIKVTMRNLAVLKVSCNQIQCAVLYRAAHTDDLSFFMIKYMYSKCMGMGSSIYQTLYSKAIYSLKSCLSVNLIYSKQVDFSTLPLISQILR